MRFMEANPVRLAFYSSTHILKNMKILKISLVVIAGLILIVFGFLWYAGIFADVTVTEKSAGGYKVVGREYTGAYSKAGKVIADVNKELEGMGVTCTKGFGIYYDDPAATPAEKCRSFVGGILEEKDLSKMEELKQRGFRLDSVAMANAVVAEFPLSSMLSYMIGPVKAYPAISKYMKERNYMHTLSMEVYDVPQKKILFIMQYSK